MGVTLPVYGFQKLRLNHFFSIIGVKNEKIEKTV
jgi:hypothetical protein